MPKTPEHEKYGAEYQQKMIKRFQNSARLVVAAFIVLVFVINFREDVDTKGRQVEPSNAETDVSIYLDFSPVISFVGFYVAEEQHFFQEAGLRVSLNYGSGANNAATVIGAGRYPLGTSSGQATLLVRGNGGDIVSLGVLYPNVPTVAVSYPSKPVRNPHDLEGKRVGVNELSATYNDYRWIFKERVINQKDIKEVAISYDYTPFLTGQIDVFFNYADQMPALTSQMKSPPLEIALTEWGLHGYGFNIIGNGSFCTQHSSVCDRFVQAVERGYRWALENPVAASQLFSKRFPEQDPAQVKAGLDRVLRLLGPSATIGSQTREGWEMTIATARESGLHIPNNVTADTVIYRR